jgi:hypothetical protein
LQDKILKYLVETTRIVFPTEKKAKGRFKEHFHVIYYSSYRISVFVGELVFLLQRIYFLRNCIKIDFDLQTLVNKI